MANNIVYIYPISKVVQTLKEKFEQDQEKYTIYETDNQREALQIVEMANGCVIVTSDYKKMLRLIKLKPQLSRSKVIKWVVVAPKKIPIKHENILYKKNVKDIINEPVTEKILGIKLEYLLKAVETAKMVEEQMALKLSKDKDDEGNVFKFKKSDQGADKDKQRLERGMIDGELDEDEDEKNEDSIDGKENENEKNKKKKKSSFFEEAQSGNLSGKGKNQAIGDGDLSGETQKSLGEFEEDKKDTSFEEDDDQNEAGNMGLKKGLSLDEEDSPELDDFEDLDSKKESKNKKGFQLDEIEKENDLNHEEDDEKKQGKKRKGFKLDEIDKELDENNNATEDEERDNNFANSEQEDKKQGPGLKGKKDEEKDLPDVDLEHEGDQEQDNDKNGQHLDAKDRENDLKGAKTDEKELDKKDGENSEEQERDSEGSMQTRSLDPREKEKRDPREEIDREAADRKGRTFEEIEREKKEVNRKEQERNHERERANLEEQEREDKERKARELAEREKKEREAREIAERERKERKARDDEDSEHDKNKGQMDETDQDRNNDSNYDEDDLENLKGKIGQTDEELGSVDRQFQEQDYDREGEKSLEYNLKEDDKQEAEEIKKEEKEQIATVLDYNEFKKEKQQIEQSIIKEEEVEEVLQKTFFDPNLRHTQIMIKTLNHYIPNVLNKADLLDYLDLLSDYLLSQFNGVASFYLQNKSSKVYEEIYSKHQQVPNLQQYITVPWQDYSYPRIEMWSTIQQVSTSDDTFQSPVIEVVYPFKEDELNMGFAVIHLAHSLKDHDTLSQIEAVLDNARGFYLYKLSEDTFATLYPQDPAGYERLDVRKVFKKIIPFAKKTAKSWWKKLVG